ncbi:MAG: hypothetical protein Q8S17_07590 [Humidesulfovibrio sp.]|nr:hypothetical protein [Humidesulfovibrio sp.]
MHSDPQAVPRGDRACPAKPRHAANGGSPGAWPSRFGLGLLPALGRAPGPVFGLIFGLILGHGDPALSARHADLGTPDQLAAQLPSTRPAAAPPQEILAAVPANLPPFYVTDADARPGGFAVELLRRVATAAGYSLRKPFTRAERLDAVEQALTP